MGLLLRADGRCMRPAWFRAAASAMTCVVVGWFAFGRGERVPILGHVDLGFHELGHLVTYPLPWDVVTAVMGSVTQVLVPLGLAAYFVLIRRELPSAALCLAWAGGSARDVSVYIADAPHEALPLIGGSHDWAFILERHLDWAAPLATAVSRGGFLLVVAGVLLATASPWLRRARRSAPSFEALTAPITVVS